MRNTIDEALPNKNDLFDFLSFTFSFLSRMKYPFNKMIQ